MKSWLRSHYYQLLNWWYFKEFKGKSMSWVFKSIHKKNLWKSRQSVSGTGSELSETKLLTKELPRLIERNQIRSLLDIPCGDWNWMSTVDLAHVKYTGADIVPDIIENNQQRYSLQQFQILDIASDPIPNYDLILCRDCLVHFSYHDIARTLQNLFKSEAKLLWCTTFTQHKNQDIITGAWRPLNLQAPPFNFPPPLELFNEGCSENKGRYQDKSMGLWRLFDLRQLSFSHSAFK